MNTADCRWARPGALISALAVVLTWVVACLAAGAQTTPPVEMAPPPANRISLDVFVADNLQHPMHGLQEQDFTVLDDGKPAKLLDFRAVEVNGGQEPVQVVILVDMINTDLTTIAREREQLGEYLGQDGGKLSHPTSIGILAESGIQMMTGSSENGAEIQEAFKKIQTSIRAVGRSAGFYGATERLQASLKQLDQLLTYENTQPGRKLILVLSPGWPLLTGAGVEEDMKQRTWVFNSIVYLTTAMREAHVTLYSLNPFDLGQSNPFLYQAYLKGVSKPKNAEYPNLALQVLAEHSGGRALVSGRDVKGEINDAVRDAGEYYQLTFAAAQPDHANEYHPLKVQVDKPGATVRTATAYYAGSALNQATSAPPAK